MCAPPARDDHHRSERSGLPVAYREVPGNRSAVQPCSPVSGRDAGIPAVRQAAGRIVRAELGLRAILRAFAPPEPEGVSSAARRHRARPRPDPWPVRRGGGHRDARGSRSERRRRTGTDGAGQPDFVFAPTQGIGPFDGFGVQLNQHVYADISGPPSNLPALEREVLAFRAPLVRIFFNTTEWTFPDRMASFAPDGRTRAPLGFPDQHHLAGQRCSVRARQHVPLRRRAGRTGRLARYQRALVTLFNEPNSTRITLAQYEQVYRLLDAELRERNVREHVHFMGGDLVGTTSPLGQSQRQWFTYLADHMGDLLDAWSVHVYWDFWDAGKIDRRLEAEVRTIFSTIPAEKRRPLFVTEFGVRGVPTFEGEAGDDPGSSPGGTGCQRRRSLPSSTPGS